MAWQPGIITKDQSTTGGTNLLNIETTVASGYPVVSQPTVMVSGQAIASSQPVVTTQSIASTQPIVSSQPIITTSPLPNTSRQPIASGHQAIINKQPTVILQPLNIGGRSSIRLQSLEEKVSKSEKKSKKQNKSRDPAESCERVAVQPKETHIEPKLSKSDRKRTHSAGEVESSTQVLLTAKPEKLLKKSKSLEAMEGNSNSSGGSDKEKVHEIATEPDIKSRSTKIKTRSTKKKSRIKSDFKAHRSMMRPGLKLLITSKSISTLPDTASNVRDPYHFHESDGSDASGELVINMDECESSSKLLEMQNGSTEVESSSTEGRNRSTDEKTRPMKNKEREECTESNRSSESDRNLDQNLKHNDNNDEGEEMSEEPMSEGTRDAKHKKGYKCRICLKSFTRKLLLERHKMSTHAQCEKSHATFQCNDKLYQCSHCTRRFRCQYELDMHVLTHSADRPHQCNFCGK